MSVVLVFSGIIPFQTVSARTLLYVAGAGPNHAPSIVDPITKTAIGFLHSAANSDHIAITPDASRAYVLDSADSSVNVVDLSTDTRVASVPLPVCNPACGASAIAISSSAAQVFVAIPGFGAIVIIDTATNSTVNQIALGATPLSLAANPKSSQFYYGWTAGLVALDTGCDCAVNGILLRIDAITAIAPSPDGTRLYLLAEDSIDNAGYLLTLDLSSFAVINSVSVGDLPFSLAVSPSGTRVYVSAPSFGGLLAVDTGTGQIVDGGPVPGPGVVAVSPDGSEVYYAEAAAPTLDVFSSMNLNIAPLQVTGFVNAPTDLAFVARAIFNYEAEAPVNILSGKAQIVRCAICSGGAAVAGVAQPGSGPTGGVLSFTNIGSVGAYSAQLSIFYLNTTPRGPIPVEVTVNGVASFLSLPETPIIQRVILNVPGQAIGTVTITGVPGTPSSSITVDRITVQ